MLIAAGAVLEVHRAADNTVRSVPLHEFFLGDHRVAMADDEVLVAISIPFVNASHRCFIQSYKQARRRDDSKGIVSAGLKVELEQRNADNDHWYISSAVFSFGGMASSTIMAKHTQQALIGQRWTRETIGKACQLAMGEMPLDDMSPGGQPEYRRTLVQSFLFKFYFYVASQLRSSLVDTIDLSAAQPYQRAVSHAQQTIPERPPSQKIVGSSMPHQSAYLHTTGEATFIDDIPSSVNTLYAAVVLSTQPNARIRHIGRSTFLHLRASSVDVVRIDTEAASQTPGFVSFVSSLDVPGSNRVGHELHDGEIFVSSVALCVGAVIGMILCDTQRSADAAAKLVQIDYELLTPTMFTIEEALAHGSYLCDEQRLQKGDANKALEESDHRLEGTLMIGGQEHFYMETNCFMVIPSNDDRELVVYMGTQALMTAQDILGAALNRDASRIKCHAKRVGGSFGGKELVS